MATILAVLTGAVVLSLLIDYCRWLRRPRHIGLWLTALWISLGIFFTLQAVLPVGNFYGRVYYRGANQPVVALTFDDGPYAPYTEQLLNVLAAAGVQATFFVVGQNVENHPELLQQIAANGHQIGNHSYSHVDLLKLSKSQIEAEVDKTQQLIVDITGIRPTLFRPPHGFRDGVVMEVMAERSLRVVDWSVMSRDWVNPGVDEIVRRTVAGVDNGAIILLHDGDGIAANASRAQTIEASRQIIRELKDRGYRFVTVEEILSLTERGGQT